MERNQLASAIALILLATGMPATVSAQEEDGVHRGGGLEQVIVQARRVEENVQDVPLAITAMSAEQLERAGVGRVMDLAVTAPAVANVPSTGRKDATSFGIRGQRADDIQLTSDQAVAVLIGGVPMNWAYGSGISGAFDISSVEVAKGPQGTLFGKNSTGGAIIITPAEPVDSVEGMIKVGVGNFNLRQLEGMYNQPLTDTLALRIAATATKQDGTFKNVNDNGDDLNSTDNWAARISLKWQPTDQLTSLLVLEDLWSASTGPAPKLRRVNPNNGVGAIYLPALAQVQSEDFFDAHTDIKDGGHNDTKMWGVLNTTTFEVSDNITIKNIAGVRDLWYDGLADLDGVSADMTNLNNPATNALPAANRARLVNVQFNSHQFTDAQSVTEELQIIGSYDLADWIAGLYYGHTDGHDGAQTIQFNGAGRMSLTGPTGGVTNESIAVFGQSTWHLTDRMNLTTGLRFTKDDREVIYQSQNYAANTGNPLTAQAASCLLTITTAAGTAVPSPCERQRNKSFHEPTWNLSFDYKLTDDSLIYVASRHGYRSGGFPGRGQTDATTQPFDQETVNDYEIGFKIDTDVAGMPLRVNTAAFYQSYKDIQRNVQFADAAGTFQTTTRNAAAATLKGAEIEFTFIPFDSLQLSGFITHVEASYDSWSDFTTTTPARLIDKSVNDFANVPQNTASLTARYTLPVPANLGEVAVAATGYYQRGTALTIENKIDNSGNECIGSRQSDWHIYNARVDWTDFLGQAGVTLAAWGKNLTNEEYFVGGLCLYNQSGLSWGYPAEPRTFGVTAAYKF